MDLEKERIKRGRDPQVELPEIEFAAHLIDAMNKIGPVRTSMSGPIPTDWDILLPFGTASERLTEPWEYEALSEMCVQYHRGLTKGKEPLCKPPMTWKKPFED